jgi:hypothetical protein
MIKDLQEKFNQIWDNLPVDALKATYLDPRIKNLPSIPPNEVKEMKLLLREECKAVLYLFCLNHLIIIKYMGSHKPTEQHTIMADLHTSPLIVKMQSLLPLQSSKPNNEQFLEWDEYNKLPNIPLGCDPLQWWKANEDQYPVLSKLARAYLAIPAAQASTERLFSLSGLCVTDRRTRLDPSVVEDLVLLSHHTKGLCKNCHCCNPSKIEPA